MYKKQKVKYLYLALMSAIFFSQSSYAISDDPADNLKATIGSKNTNTQGMTVNPDGSIILKGNNNAKPKQQAKEETIVLSGSDKVNETENKNEKISDKLENHGTNDENKSIEEDFQGGIGKPYYSVTGVLIFNGSDKDKKKQEKQDTPKAPTQSNDEYYSPVPDIKLDKIPIDVKNMPLPSNLPPLPTENGNVMLPVSLPTSKAVDLPPLPDFFIPNLGVSVGTIDEEGVNNFGIPVNPDGKPINYKGRNSIFVGEKNKALSNEFVDYMKQAANKFLNLGIPMKVVIVDTEDYELRRFVANNVLRSNKNNFESIDTGLTSILSLDNKMNKNEIPICYIVLKNDQQKSLMDQYIRPLSNTVNEKTIAAYLVAHQVSHCMDNLERFKQLPKVSTWFPDDAKKVGLASSAIRRLYPYGMTYQQYARTTMHLYDDLAQRQYQERIGDIFGLYLTVFAGYDESIFDGIIKLRDRLAKNSSHNTYDAINNIKADYISADKLNIKTLWQSARKLQTYKDVDSSLQYGANENMYKASLNKNQDLSESSITEEFDPKKKQEKKSDPNSKPVNFNTVPKFGENKNNNSNYFGTSKNETTIKE